MLHSSCVSRSTRGVFKFTCRALHILKRFYIIIGPYIEVFDSYSMLNIHEMALLIRPMIWLHLSLGVGLSSVSWQT